MIIMAGQSNPFWHYSAGKWPGSVGLLFCPSYFKLNFLQEWFPYALDNGAFTAWTKQHPWCAKSWIDMLQLARMSGKTPVWALVPDVVGNRNETLANWGRFASVIGSFGWTKAFAVQDGMNPKDVPEDASVIFVGGTTEWKWRNLEMWAKSFPRIHVGRVNSIRRLVTCEKFNVESVDGTGWFRDPSDPNKLKALKHWFEGFRPEHPELNYE